MDSHRRTLLEAKCYRASAFRRWFRWWSLDKSQSAASQSTHPSRIFIYKWKIEWYRLVASHSSTMAMSDPKIPTYSLACSPLQSSDKPTTSANFAGLIELHEAVRFDQPFSRPANLPTTCKRTPDNSIVFAVGNGQIDSRHLTLQNTTLRQAVLRTLPHKDCAQVYTRNSLLSNPSMVICVESIGEGGVFSGDSGEEIELWSWTITTHMYAVLWLFRWTVDSTRRRQTYWHSKLHIGRRRQDH